MPESSGFNDRNASFTDGSRRSCRNQEDPGAQINEGGETVGRPAHRIAGKAGNSKCSLSPDAKLAVESLKMALTTAPVLVHADFKRRFFIQCDASHVRVGAVLFQRDDDGQEQPIAFFSAKMNNHQVNYTVTEKECVATLMAIRKFRPYIEGIPFTYVTDHASSKKRSENGVADTLSQCVEVLVLDPTELLGFETTKFAKEDYLGLVKDVNGNLEHLPDLKIEDGLIFKRVSQANPVDEVEGSEGKGNHRV
ncbi:uncharacterized protein LOC121529962 [Drosophila eugracilis]|uniref:uncharacterized protein LOC121529962 n=1 Tax=Drosophila eugracilis TaxID=29029 RepID=UPI001BDA0773|nr:uncharacterized protein LOC121529962 [Drosophila eugracilis]